MKVRRFFPGLLLHCVLVPIAKRLQSIITGTVGWSHKRGDANATVAAMALTTTITDVIFAIHFKLLHAMLFRPPKINGAHVFRHDDECTYNSTPLYYRAFKFYFEYSLFRICCRLRWAYVKHFALCRSTFYLKIIGRPLCASVNIDCTQNQHN